MPQRGLMIYRCVSFQPDFFVLRCQFEPELTPWTTRIALQTRVFPLLSTRRRSTATGSVYLQFGLLANGGGNVEKRWSELAQHSYCGLASLMGVPAVSDRRDSPLPPAPAPSINCSDVTLINGVFGDNLSV